ncbi:MAG: hypothetical protein QOE51_1047 [Actinoplanes sp.]|nr:hypothetical protein [Actinoplanes sp.]
MKRRKRRIVLPLAVVLVLLALTIIAHVAQQGDPTDESFLSPTSNADDGAARLAGRLSAAGVRVDRRTTTPEVLAAANGGTPATVLVTTPSLIYPGYLPDLRDLPSGTRLVLIAPDQQVLSYAGIDAEVTGSRWAAAAPAPGCSAPFATGPAAVRRATYATGAYPDQTTCYGGGVLEVNAGGSTITLVGASDAFRNDRSGEHANQALAVALLSRSPRVVWLDLHEHEVPPRPELGATSKPAKPAETAEPVPTNAPDHGNDSDPNDGGNPGAPGGDGDQQGGDSGGGLAQTALGQAFPPAVWATLLLLVLAGLAVALASARRLGAPVAEPLPVRVRAAETVRGLGGLYRRAKARDTSLATLQGAAVHRLADHFGMPHDSSTADVAERVAGYTGQDADEVRAVLGAAAEGTDRDLTRAATAVQSLVRHVTQRQVTNEGNVL